MGIDVYFSKPLIPGNWKKRAIITLLAGTVAMVVTILILRPTLPFTDSYLWAAKEKGTMSFAVLIVIVEYFLWSIPFILIKGWIVREWGLRDEIKEKRQAWWSYVMVGSIATFVMMAAPYVAVTIIPPLMVGVGD